ncbi:MAG: AI-2E family transporter [Burkholderiales bacterium]|jgi:predicted PurR-regulated permease PerM|nr:AI-2E family transporter [Burkholderiales bacterium]
MDRLRTLVYLAVLTLIVGWVLHIGRSIFIPIVLGAVVVYVIVGLTHAQLRIPVVGALLPVQLRTLLAVLFIGLIVGALVYLVLANKERVLALTPKYQESLLAAIQSAAVMLGIESEPTWATLRQDLLALVNVRSLVGSMVSSVSSIILSIVVVLLYATFLLVETRAYPGKLDHLSDTPQGSARIRQLAQDVNARIGSYLALKTLISVLLGAVCWVLMRWVDLEFAGFWAVLITLLNFIPYIGSFLAVLFPVAMAIAQFQDPGVVFYLALGLIAVQFLIGNFLDPYLMGNSLNLSPFAILVSLAVWSELWGIAGAFLAVPITAVIVIVFSEFASTRPVAVLLSRTGQLRAPADRHTA